MTWHCVNAQNREIAKRSVIEDAIVGIAISLSANAWVTVAIDLNTALSAPWSISCVHSSWLLIISLSVESFELRIINKKSRQREILSRDTRIRNKSPIYVYVIRFCKSEVCVCVCVCNCKMQIRDGIGRLSRLSRWKNATTDTSDLQYRTRWNNHVIISSRSSMNM